MMDFLSRKLAELNCGVKVSQHNIVFEENEKSLGLYVQAVDEDICMENVWHSYFLLKEEVNRDECYRLMIRFHLIIRSSCLT